MAKAEMKVETVVNRDIVLTLSLDEAVCLRTLLGRSITSSFKLTQSILSALEDASVPSCNADIFKAAGLYLCPVTGAEALVAEKVLAFYG